MKHILFYIGIFSCVTLDAEIFFTPEMISTHLKDYSEEEILLLDKDRQVVRSVCLEGTKNTENRFYLATAGAPGACKTTILEKFISNHLEYQKGVYLDPDARTLRYMVHTYYARSLNPLTLSLGDDYDQIIRNAYDKWRAGSNYIVLSLLEEAYDLGRSVIYGTTSTGGHISEYFTRLKENNYEIVLLLCFCPDDLRYRAVDYRNSVVRFYQSSPEDALAKGILFPQRMSSYFTHADQLYFYWSDSLLSPERLAGIWRNGTLEICDKDAMQCVIDKYELDRRTLEKTDVSIPAFSDLVHAYSNFKAI